MNQLQRNGTWKNPNSSAINLNVPLLARLQGKIMPNKCKKKVRDVSDSTSTLFKPGRSDSVGTKPRRPHSVGTKPQRPLGVGTKPRRPHCASTLSKPLGSDCIGTKAKPGRLESAENKTGTPHNMGELHDSARVVSKLGSPVTVSTISESEYQVSGKNLGKSEAGLNPREMQATDGDGVNKMSVDTPPCDGDGVNKMSVETPPCADILTVDTISALDTISSTETMMDDATVSVPSPLYSTTTTRPGTAATPDLRPGTVATPDLRPDTVATPDLRPDMVATPDLRPGTAATPDLRPDTVATPDLRPDMVATPDLRPGTAATPDLRPDMVATPDLRPGTAATPDLRHDSLLSVSGQFDDAFVSEMSLEGDRSPMENSVTLNTAMVEGCLEPRRILHNEAHESVVESRDSPSVVVASVDAGSPFPNQHQEINAAAKVDTIGTTDQDTNKQYEYIGANKQYKSIGAVQHATTKQYESSHHVLDDTLPTANGESDPSYSDVFLSSRRKRARTSKFTRVKRRKVQAEDGMDAVVAGGHMGYQSRGAGQMESGSDSPMDIVKTPGVAIVCDDEMSMKTESLLSCGDADIARSLLVDSQLSSLIPPSASHVTELRLDDLVLPFDDEAVDVLSQTKTTHKPRSRSHTTPKCQQLDKPAADLASLEVPCSSKMDPKGLNDAGICVESLILPFDDAIATPETRQFDMQDPAKKRRARTKKRRSQIFYKDDITVESSPPPTEVSCAAMKEPACVPQEQPQLVEINLPSDEVDMEIGIVYVKSSFLENQEQAVEAIESKPVKRRGRRRSSDFEIINASLVIASPDQASPSESSYLPLGQSSSRRSKRLRRKSVVISKAQSRMQKEKQCAEVDNSAPVADSGQCAEVTEPSTPEVMPTAPSADVEMSSLSNFVEPLVGNANTELLPVAAEVAENVSDTVEVAGELAGESSVIINIMSADMPAVDMVVIDSSSDSPADRSDVLMVEAITPVCDSNFEGNATPDSPSGRTQRSCRKKPQPVQKAATKAPPRKKAQNVVSIEDIYRNKLWRTQMPVEKSWETIHEQPVTKKSGTAEYLSKKRFKRNINFEEFYTKTRLKKRRQRAMKHGWKPITPRRDAAAAVLLSEKLSILEYELQLEAVGSRFTDPRHEEPAPEVVRSLSYEHLPEENLSQEDVFYTPAKSFTKPVKVNDSRSETRCDSSVNVSLEDDSEMYKTPLKDCYDSAQSKSITVLESPDSGLGEEPQLV